MGAPAVTTLIRAINNNWLTSFPGLTANGIRKHLPKSIQTTMGHMHKVRQNIRSTKAVTMGEIMDERKDSKDPSEDYLPPQEIKNRDHFARSFCSHTRETIVKNLTSFVVLTYINPAHSFARHTATSRSIAVRLNHSVVTL